MARQAPLHPPTARERHSTGAFTPFARRVRQSNQAGGMMKPGVLVLILPLLFGLAVFPAGSHATQTADPDLTALVEWASGESAERLSRSSHKADFFPLSNHFISQDNAIFCGPVSSAIVLNALRLGKKDGLPRDRQSIAQDELVYLPDGADPFYGKYTPNNVLSERTKTRLEVLGKPILVDGDYRSDFGLQLRPTHCPQMLSS